MATAKRSAFLPDSSQPPLAQAVSLALSIMRTAKVTRWEQLNYAVPYEVALYPGQLQLLRDHAYELQYIRIGGEDQETKTRVPTVSLAVCPACGLWLLLDKQPPKRCQLTIGCTGEPVKASPAPKASIPTLEDGRE